MAILHAVAILVLSFFLFFLLFSPFFFFFSLGILGHLEEDAKTFSEWGVDYIKVDGCYAGKYVLL